MYPKQSNFQSSEPGSAWVFVGTVTDTPQVLVTQWDAVIRNLQRKLLLLLPAQWSFNTTTATAGNGTARTAASITVSGRWDDVTAEGFCYLAACTTVPGSPTNLKDVVDALPTTAKPQFGEALLQAIVMAAFFLNEIGTPDAPADLTQDKGFQVAGSGFDIPATTILPSLAVTVTSPAADAAWYAIYRPVTDATPVPPSVAQNALAAPAKAFTTEHTYSAGWLVGAGLIGLGVGWALSRYNPR